MENQIADALLKIAEVHDRRLGEIGITLARLADQFTHSDRLDISDSGVDHLAREISNLSATLDDKLGDLAPQQNSD